MILSDKSILKMLREGSLRISPVQEEQIQPASVDIRLGNTFSIVEDSGICPDGLPGTSSLQRKNIRTRKGPPDPEFIWTGRLQAGKLRTTHPAIYNI